jgi:hypothetical protein
MEQFKNWHPTEPLKNSNSESSAPAVGNLATASKFFQGEPAEIGIAAELWTLSAVRCESPMNCISFRFLIVLRRALPLALFLLQPQPCESAPAEQITNEFSGNQTDGLKPVRANNKFCVPFLARDGQSLWRQTSIVLHKRGTNSP